jgi:hypothetical protein
MSKLWQDWIYSEAELIPAILEGKYTEPKDFLTLLKSCNGRSVEFIKLCITQAEFDINKKIKDDWSENVPMFYAYESLNVNAVKVLLELNADPNIIIDDNKVCVTVELVTFKENINRLSKDWIQSDEEVIKQIMDGVYDLAPAELLKTLVGRSGNSNILVETALKKYKLRIEDPIYLYIACYSRNYERIKKLLELGASVHTKYDEKHVVFYICSTYINNIKEATNIINIIKLFEDHMDEIMMYECSLILKPAYNDARHYMKNFIDNKFNTIMQNILKNINELETDDVKEEYELYDETKKIRTNESFMFGNTLLNFRRINIYIKDDCYANLKSQAVIGTPCYFSLINKEKVIVEFIPYEYIDDVASYLKIHIHYRSII